MYYPDQRAASPYIVIRRDVNLPDEAVGVIRARDGSTVDIRDVVANGVVSVGYLIIEAADYLGLKTPEELNDLMLVETGNLVEEGKILAGRSETRGRRISAPTRGIVSAVDNGRIIMQDMPDLLDLEAGVRGRVTQVRQGNGLTIEATGAQIHGIWGNGKRIISALRKEPETGLQTTTNDMLEMRFSGTVMFTRTPITARSFEVMKEQTLAGVIAPSMDSSLVELAVEAEGVILLTEGFGNMNMNPTTFNMLEEFDGQQVTVDGHQPNRWETRYPEVIINVQSRDGQRPTRPNVMLSLRTGLSVRLTREPFLGQTGSVINLPKTPVLLDNGLRVPCAEVQLVAGETLLVPLANLEVLGR